VPYTNRKIPRAVNIKLQDAFYKNNLSDCVQMWNFENLHSFNCQPQCEKKNPSPSHYPRGSRLLAFRLFPSMIPKQRRRILCVLFQTSSRCTHTVSHDSLYMCVHWLLLPSRNTGIVTDNTNLARTHARGHARGYARSLCRRCYCSFSLFLFLSLPLSFSRENIASTRIFGSAGRDGWARPSFGQGAVLQGFPRDLPRARLMRYGRRSQRNPCIGNDGLASPLPLLFVVLF